MIHSRKGKKGNTGIATLFILIGILLIAVVFSVVYMKYSQSLKNQAGSMFQRAQDEASSAIKTLEIAGTDGTDGHLNNFTKMIRVLPGSAEIRLETCSLMFSAGSERATLRYREGGSLERSNTGFNTWTVQDLGTVPLNAWVALEEDLDDDRKDDYLMVNESHVMFNISSTNGNLSIFPVNQYNASEDLSLGNRMVNNAGTIEVQGQIFGSFTLVGLNPNTTVIDSSVTFTVTPYRNLEGYYTVEYIARSGTPVQNVLMEGDTANIYIQSFKNIHADEFVTFNFLCPVLVPIEKTLYTGTTLPKQKKVILYPSI